MTLGRVEPATMIEAGSGSTHWAKAEGSDTGALASLYDYFFMNIMQWPEYFRLWERGGPDLVFCQFFCGNGGSI